MCAGCYVAVRSFFLLLLPPPLKLKKVSFSFCFVRKQGQVSFTSIGYFPFFLLLYVSHEYRVLTCYSPFETVQLAQEAEASFFCFSSLPFPVEAATSSPHRPLHFSCPLFFFCSNKRAFILWGQSGSPLVHQVLRYQRDSPLLLLEFTGGIFISFTCTDGILEGRRI